MKPEDLFHLAGNDNHLNKFLKACGGHVDWVDVILRTTRKGKPKLILRGKPNDEFWRKWYDTRCYMMTSGVNVQKYHGEMWVEFFVPDKTALKVMFLMRDATPLLSNLNVSKEQADHPDWSKMSERSQIFREHWNLLAPDARASIVWLECKNDDDAQ